MRRRTVTIGAMTGAMAALGMAAAVPSLGAQQQVQVIVTAVPNPVPAGSCTGIWVEVRDAANQRLNDLNGVPLHSRSYDYSIPNTPGFAWRDNDPTSGYLCAQLGVGTVNIPVTATVRSTSYSGATIVTIQSGAPSQVAAANPPAGAGAAGAAAGAAQPGYGQPAGADPSAGGAPAGAAAAGAPGQPGYGQASGGAPAGAAQPAYGQPAGAAPSAGGAPAGAAAAGAPGQAGYGQAAGGAPAGAAQPAYGQPAGAAPSGGAPAGAAAGAPASAAAGAAPAGYAQPGGAPQQAGYAPPPAAANPYTPPQSPVPGQPYATQPSEAPAQAQPVAAAVQPVAAAPAEKKKGGGGFLKKFGNHLKQRASEVTSQTAATLASSATQLVDTTLQTGSGLVSGTVAGAGNAARMTIGGAGKSLLPSALRGAETSDNLASAVASGRAVLRAMRFTPGTAVLEPSSHELAVRLAGELKKVLLTSPGIFLVAVHVDPILTPAGAPIPSAGQQLSEQRAATVKAVLVQNGVLPTQLIALGYGASQPLPETAPDGSSTSARVEIARTQ